MQCVQCVHSVCVCVCVFFLCRQRIWFAFCLYRLFQNLSMAIAKNPRVAPKKIHWSGFIHSHTRFLTCLSAQWLCCIVLLIRYRFCIFIAIPSKRKKKHKPCDNSSYWLLSPQYVLYIYMLSMSYWLTPKRCMNRRKKNKEIKNRDEYVAVIAFWSSDFDNFMDPSQMFKQTEKKPIQFKCVCGQKTN